MPTRNVVLTDHQELFIGGLVSSGRYQNASEVLREGLRLLEQREAEYSARLAALRQAIDDGQRDFAEGRFETLTGSADLSDCLDRIEADSSNGSRE